ncbi:MAG TPA: hypothetical protein VGR27_09485, partial [Longimicrobiaceae bacterium]|nr:hypothetical protein [Longimicrobiaceae bacterium]
MMLPLTGVVEQLLHDVLGRGKVRIADPQVDHIFTGVDPLAFLPFTCAKTLAGSRAIRAKSLLDVGGQTAGAVTE